MSPSKNALKNILIFLTLISVLFFFLQGNIIKWLTTESTDNAYVDGDISLISAEVGGIVKDVAVLENSVVKVGDRLVKLDDADYNAKLEQAKAQLQAGENAVYVTEFNIKLENINSQKLKDSLNLMQAEVQVAENDFKRTTSLNKDSFSSIKLVDNAKVNLEKAGLALKKCKLDIESSEYNLSLLNLKKSSEMANLVDLNEAVKLAEKALANTAINAPVEGIITNISAKVGSYAAPGRPLFAIVEDNSLTIKANFKETQIHKIRPGMLVSIEIDALKGKGLEGRIRSISPATGSKFSLLPTDTATGNFTKVVQRIPVTIDFSTPEQYKDLIIPGMSAKVSVQVK